jgi:prepilin-type N-terminal cleavage/methylation domain-containing protein
MKSLFPTIPGSRDRRTRAPGFTLVELLMVITIIGILAALVVGLIGVASKKSRENQVKAVLTELVTAIEAYKTRMGHYPPDNPGNPGTNSLFYELIGTSSTNNGTTFLTADRLFSIDSASINAAYGSPGFVNAAPTTNQVRSFLKGLKATRHAALPSPPNPPGVQALIVPAPGAGGAFNPWRYNSSNPTNNPRSFDLWAEFEAGGITVTIGNWNFR